MTRKERLEFIDKWIAALRSGEYKQGGGGFLRNNANQFCCLGVGCHLLGAKWTANNSWDAYEPSGIQRSVEYPLDTDAYHDLGFLNREDMRRLANMNDDGNTFAEIADWIEAHKEELAGVDHA